MFWRLRVRLPTWWRGSGLGFDLIGSDRIEADYGSDNYIRFGHRFGLGLEFGLGFGCWARVLIVRSTFRNETKRNVTERSRCAREATTRRRRCTLTEADTETPNSNFGFRISDIGPVESAQSRPGQEAGLSTHLPGTPGPPESTHLCWFKFSTQLSEAQPPFRAIGCLGFNFKKICTLKKIYIYRFYTVLKLIRGRMRWNYIDRKHRS